MLYYLAQLREVFFGFNIFRYITFRAALAAVTAFLLSMILGPLVIRAFRRGRIHEDVKRKDCPALDEFHQAKAGTPTMGGIFVIGSILISVLLWADLTNWYIRLTFMTCLALAFLGGIDDWIKLKKTARRGLRARTKFAWQLALGCVIGAFIYCHPSLSTQLDVPFCKSCAINIGIFYIPFAILVIVGSSNAVNLTDGLDGLAIGCVLIVSFAMSILSYISGHLKFSEYLLVPYIPGAGELTVFCAAIVGASLGFLWFNCYPASIFMGDVGSLALGGTLGVVAVLIKKELLLGLLGGIFVIEALSVILQVTSFQIRGKRLFKVSPFHHHLQLSGWNESKIIVRFWIIAIILALLTLVTLKIR